MAAMYADEAAASRILAGEGDRLIYEVQGVELPAEEGQLPHCTTRILPGRVGDEYHMTKGHYHENRGASRARSTSACPGADSWLCRPKAANPAC